MNEKWLMKKVKYGDSVSQETFIEHAIKTFQVGQYLYDQVKPNFGRAIFLYCCVFHDVGKILAPTGAPHTPKSRESLQQISKTKDYTLILKALGLEDFSDNKQVIHAIEKHHDADEKLSAYTAIADQIASSQSDDQLKNYLKTSPISTLITYLNEMHGFSEIHFYNVRFYSFSKNEFNAVGKLFLLKLLYETVEQISNVTLLYESFNGCRIATKLDSKELTALLTDAFNKNLISFMEKQNLKDVLGGAPDNYAQFTNLPKEIKPQLVKLTTKKYEEDIVNSLEQKKIEKIEDVGLSFEVLTKFVALSEVANLAKNGIKGTSNTKYYLLGDKDKTFTKWIVETFSLTESATKDKINPNSVPILEQLLSKVGVDVKKVTCKEVVYNKLSSLVVATNSINESKIDFCFDIGKYIAIDDEISLEKIARENICANCGTFEGEVELTPFIFKYKQHAKETLFKETADEFRDREKVICGLCQVEATFNTLLCGTVLANNQARIDTKTHMIFCSLGVPNKVFEDIVSFQDVPIQKIIERFNITKHSVYLKKENDLQYLLMSISNTEKGIENSTFQWLLFSVIVSNLKQICLLLAVGINKIPTFFDADFIQFSGVNLPIIDDIRTDFFKFIYRDSNFPPQEQKNIILQYINRPFIGLAQIFKKTKQKYTEDIQELVNRMSKDDPHLFGITNRIWEMAKISGSLETRKNVGSFLAGFNGSSISLDTLVNRLLKNSQLTVENRRQVIEIHEELRHELEEIDDKKRAQLKNYIQKTKHLFNSKKFYEIGREKQQ
jgi:hypothetical protein